MKIVQKYLVRDQGRKQQRGNQDAQNDSRLGRLGRGAGAGRGAAAPCPGTEAVQRVRASVRELRRRLARPGDRGRHRDRPVQRRAALDARPGTNNASGIDVEINHAVAEWLGIKDVKYEWIPWAEQIPSLLSKRTDVIGQNIHVNPDRVKVISFSGPAWWYGPVVLVEKGNPDGIKSYDDLKGKDVGAIAGSAAEAYLRRIGVNTVTFKSEVEELQSLSQGRVKYVVEDDVVFTVFDKRTPATTSRRSGASRRPTTSSSAAATAARASASARRTACCAPPTASLWGAAQQRHGQRDPEKVRPSDRNLVWFKLNP